MFEGFKNPFRFSREERLGVFVLIALIIAVFGAKYAYRAWLDRRTGQALAESITDEKQEAYRRFAATVRQKEEESRWKPSDQRTPYPEDRNRRTNVPTPFPFDPNTADSLLFRRLGLPDWMAKNILRYRERGGKFRKPEDFSKIYGLTDEQFVTLRPYIRIAPPTADSTPHPAPVHLTQAPKDTTALPYKYPAGTVIDLNRADTTELKKIPGIGSFIARRITDYRQRLGGFRRIEQLREIHLDHEPLRPWLHIDTTAIRRIDLNHAGIERLRRHPYFNFYQAKVIVEHRRKHGPLHSLKPLALYEEFTEADLERIEPYVCFE